MIKNIKNLIMVIAWPTIMLIIQSALTEDVMKSALT